MAYALQSTISNKGYGTCARSVLGVGRAARDDEITGADSRHRYQEVTMRSLTHPLIPFAAGIILAGLIAGDAMAQALRNAAERRQDKREIRLDRRMLADDAADLDRLSDLVMEWNGLRRSGADQNEIDAAMSRIALELRRDLVETSGQVGQAKAEVRQSAGEVRSDKREIRKDRRKARRADAHGHNAAEHRARRGLRDDRRDLRDDRRDLRDDIRDEERASEILERKRSISRELIGLQRMIDEGGAVDALRDRQTMLLEEYVSHSREEIEMGYRELKEDKRELREDRRETREDRRQRTR